MATMRSICLERQWLAALGKRLNSSPAKYNQEETHAPGLISRNELPLRGRETPPTCFTHMSPGRAGICQARAIYIAARAQLFFQMMPRSMPTPAAINSALIG